MWRCAQEEEEGRTAPGSPVDVALEACREVAKSRIRTAVLQKTGKTSRFGVLLYNTRLRTRAELADESTDDENDDDDEMHIEEDTANDLRRQQPASAQGNSKGKEDEGYDDDEDDEDDLDGIGFGPLPTNVHTLLPLSTPGIRTVQRLQDYLPCPLTGQRPRQLQQEYGHEDDKDDDGASASSPPPGTSSLQGALYEAMAMFRKVLPSSSQRNNKRSEESIQQVWILTNHDNPLGNVTNHTAAPATASVTTSNTVRSYQLTAQQQQQQQQQQHLLQVIQNTARDVQDHGIQILVWPLVSVSSSSSNNFDYSLFYEPVLGALTPAVRLSRAQDDDDDTDDEEADDSDGRHPMVRRLVDAMLLDLLKRPRPAFSLPFVLPQPSSMTDPQNESTKENGSKTTTTTTTACIPTDWYRLVHFREPPKHDIRVHQHTGLPLVRLTQTLDDAQRVIRANEQQHRLRTFVEFGEERVFINKHDDIVRLKQACNAKDYASCILLGFKDKNAINLVEHTLEMAYFVYPKIDQGDEDKKPTAASANVVSTGTWASANAFAHLHASMLRKRVLAMGELLTKRTAIPVSGNTSSCCGCCCFRPVFLGRFVLRISHA